MAKYEVTFYGKKDNRSVVFASTGTRGLALSSNTVSAEGEITAVLASASNPDFIGHLSRNVTATGLPTDNELLFKNDGETRRLEDPDKAGGRVTAEDVEEFDAEGDMLFSGTHAITSGTALHSPITFENGLPRVAQSGEYAFYSLIGKPDAVEGSTFRCKFRRINPTIVP